MGKTPKKWSCTKGDRPNTVTVAERSRGSPVYEMIWVPEGNAGKGKYVRRSLKFKVRDEKGNLIPEAVERAETHAMTQALKLRQGRHDPQSQGTTLSQVFGVYKRYRTRRKTEREQNADVRRMEMWSRVLGRTADPHRVSLRDWEGFIEARSSGAINSRGKHIAEVDSRRPVRPRVVKADCDWLRWVFDWATDFAVEGSRVMRENPLTRRFRDQVPSDKNPRRPVATWERYETIRAKTDEVLMTVEWGPKPEQVRSHLSELLDLAVATGRRISAIRLLRYRDLRLTKTESAPHGAIYWPADTDKAGKEATIPLNTLGRRAIDRVLRERPGVGDQPLFRSPGDESKPVSRYLPDRWLREAEGLAGVEPMDGSLWHAYRRMWVTARKDLPAQDVARAGGWSTVRMVEEVYTQADEETTLSVVLHEGRVREAR